jgi:hypothetical protein
VKTVVDVTSVNICIPFCETLTIECVNKRPLTSPRSSLLKLPII